MSRTACTRSPTRGRLTALLLLLATLPVVAGCHLFGGGGKRRARRSGSGDRDRDDGRYKRPRSGDFQKVVGELVGWGDMYCRSPKGWRGPCDPYEILFPRRTEGFLTIKTDKPVRLAKLKGWKLIKRSANGKTHRYEGRFDKRKRVKIKLFNLDRLREPVYYMLKVWPRPRYLNSPRRNTPQPRIWRSLRQRTMKKKIRRGFYRGPYVYLRDRKRSFPAYKMWKKHQTAKGSLSAFEALDVKTEPDYCYGFTLQLTPGSRFSGLALRDLAIQGGSFLSRYRQSILVRGKCGARRARVWTTDVFLYTLRNTPMRNKLGFGRYVLTVYRRPTKWQGRLDNAGFRRELLKYTRRFRNGGVVARGKLGSLGTLRVPLQGNRCHILVMTLSKHARFSPTVLRRGALRTDVRLPWGDVSAGPGLRGRGLIMDVGCLPKKAVGRVMIAPYDRRAKLGWGAFTLTRYSRTLTAKEARCNRCQKVYATCEEAGGSRCSRRRTQCFKNQGLRRGDCD